MKRCILEICTKMMILFSLINIISYYPVTYLKENQLNVEILKEGQTDSQIELYDLNTILIFDDSVWCLNNSKNCVMVFSKEGIFKRIFNLPGIRDKGSSQMYIYHDQLCIRDKRNVLYQFASIDEYKKIKKNDNEVQIFNKAGKMIDEIVLDKEYDDVLLFLEGQCYLNLKESDEIIIYEESGKKQRKEIDYEKLTNSLGNKKDLSENVIYQIGGVNNKIVKIIDGKKEILRRSGVGELLFLSADMHLLLIILLIIVQSARYFLQHIFCVNV
ncbi:hypothetical protein FMM74_020645 [Lachnospiraceae bacterium MD308]|nr:hypothetical protein [Lachnospiraceae bacterium MD308]